MQTMEDRRRGFAGLGYGFVAAAALLMLCSLNSFLYPLNPWDDVNCFVTVGRGILNGLMPYRDLAEQKGPMLYALHALALWVCPNSYHGLYFLEVLALGAFLGLMWRMIRLYDETLSPAWMALLATAVCVSDAFRFGDSAEELCLPFVAASMLAALRSLKDRAPIPLRGYMLHGALAGCVLWMKFSLLGPHFTFMAALAILAFIDDRDPRRALGMCGMFLLGMLAASLPWLVWLGAEGALGDMLRMYFHDNLFAYVSRSYPVPLQVIIGLGKGMLCSPVLASLIVAGLALALVPRGRMGAREKLFLALAFGFTALMVYGGGRRFDYYFLLFAPFAGFALLAVAPVREWLRGRRGGPILPGARRALSLALCAAFLLAGVGVARLATPGRRYIGAHWEDTPQGRIGAYIAAREDRTLLNLHDLDLGVYFAADTLPVNRYFCLLNVNREAGMADQMTVVAEGRVRFLVTRGITLGEVIAETARDCPGLVAEDFEPAYEEVMRAGSLYLYERIG